MYCSTRYIIIWLESNIKYSIVEPGFSGNVDGNYEKGSLPLYNMVSGCARRKWLQSRQETPSASSPTPPTRVLGGRQAHAFRPRGSDPKGLLYMYCYQLLQPLPALASIILFTYHIYARTERTWPFGLA